MKFYIVDIHNIRFMDSECNLDDDLISLYHSLCDINKIDFPWFSTQGRFKNKTLLYIKQEIDNHTITNTQNDICDLIDLYHTK